MITAQICLTPFNSLGGPAKNYQQFHFALNTMAICFARPGEGAKAEAIVPPAVWIETVRTPGLWRYYYTPRRNLTEAERVMADADCVIIHGFYRMPIIWAARLARRRRIPYVIVLHGILDPWTFQKNRLFKELWIKLYGRAILRNARIILCATHRERDKARPYLQPGRTRVLAWGCEIEDLGRHRGERDRIRRNLGLAPTDRVLIYLGRIHSMKRPRETVKLLAEMNDPRLKLLLVGPDGDVSGAELKQLALKLRWNGLRVVGPVFGSEKYDYFCAADAYISLSWRENFNFTAAEAMLCGLPPILSEGNDLGWEFNEEGFSWQLRNFSDREARAAVGGFLQAAESELKLMGEKAREWSTKNLSVEKFRDGLRAIVHSIPADFGGSPRNRS